MTLYRYSLVRCVPEPRTGEFINVGAIAGSEIAADWDVRQIANMRRASRMCGSEQMTSVLRFLASVARDIESSEDGDEGLPDAWLDDLHANMQNVVQLSAPQSAVADSASGVLDIVFDRMLIDPETTARSFTSKHALLKALRVAYQANATGVWKPVEKPEVHVGAHLRTPLDFAFASDKQAVQISQAWTFQKGTIEEVATEVKSWGYALGRLRDGDKARVLSREGRVIPIENDVAIEVLIAPPRTSQQVEVYEEAREVFDELGAETSDLEQAEVIGQRAKQLIDA